MGVNEMNKLIVLSMLTLLVAMSVAFALPSAGDKGVDNSYGSYNYEVCRADSSSAWLSADNSGTYSPINVCNLLGYADVDAVGGTCGTVCGYCGNQGYEYFDGAGGNKNKLQYTVTWRCVDYQGNDTGNDEEVPEFGILAAAGVLVVAAGFIFLRRR